MQLLKRAAIAYAILTGTLLLADCVLRAVMR